MLETVRQCALEKLGESGDAETVRARHRDHFTAIATLLDTRTDHQRRVEQAELEIDNLRAAFAWSCENGETALALQLASALQPLWLTRGRLQEGTAWLNAALADAKAHEVEVPPAVRAGALADKTTLEAIQSIHENIDEAQHVLGFGGTNCYLVSPPPPADTPPAA
jgi:hypothetical protein